MNDLVIIQTTQGLAQYLLSETNTTIPVSFDLLQNVEMTDSINYEIYTVCCNRKKLCNFYLYNILG